MPPELFFRFAVLTDIPLLTFCCHFHVASYFLDPRADETFDLSVMSLFTCVAMEGRWCEDCINEETLELFLQFLPRLSFSRWAQTTCLDFGQRSSDRKELVSLLLPSYSVSVNSGCEVIPRVRAPFFNDAALVLNWYLRRALDPIPIFFCWHHQGFTGPSVDLYSSDGVLVNSFGDYCLYRSYRGAMLKVLRMLPSFPPSL